jgi:putative peptide zinc metalloprotease protein
VQQGQAVAAGQSLFRLSSPELDYNIKIVSRRLEDLLAIRNSSQAVASLAQKRMTIDNEIETVRKQLDGYKKIRDQLDIKAPFAGQMKNIDPSLHAGQWVRHDFLLGLLADDSSRILSGYVREQDVARLSENSSGIFYADYSPLSTFPVVLKYIGKTAAYEIFWPELSSMQKGPIPSEKGPQGQIQPSPRYNIYAVRLDLMPSGAGPHLPDFIARGKVRIRGASQSLANYLINKVFSGFVAEGGL